LETALTDGPDIDPAFHSLSPSESALAEKAERYRSLFAYSPHGVFSLDLTGRLTDANDALRQLTGHSLSELLDINYHEIVHPDDIEAAENAFAAVIERVPQLLEARLVTASGEVRAIKMTAVPVIVYDQVVGVHGIAEDITEANRMHRDLEAANAAKTLFLANVSHEVRTPLTMVIAATEMLLDTDLDPTQDRLTDMLNRNSQRLLRLVNDILDFSRLEAGKISLLPAPFRLADVVDDLLEWAQPRAAARGLQLSVSLDAELSTSVYGDALRVSQVLSNLVDNALKFTESGSVDIKVIRTAATTPDPETDALHRVEFTVTDTGVGISPEHLELLFDSFTQADPTATRRHDGVGLGLAICRDLVDLMSGDLDAVSTPGVGTTFTVVLPLVDLPDERAETPQAPK
jgi:PAS domain S-box-containing protein